jgi:hypothetical protein
MSAAPRQPLIIDASEDLRGLVQSEADRLNLTPPAYLRYLIERQRPGVDPARFDRIVEEVFGRHGSTVRKLAK